MAEAAPNEILENIFSQATKDDLTVVSLCNHRFAEIAQKMIYRDISVNLNTRSTPFIPATQWLLLFRGNPKLGPYVKDLGVYVSPRDRYNEEAAAIFPYLTHVREVSLGFWTWKEGACADALLALLAQPSIRDVSLNGLNGFPLSTYCNALEATNSTPQSLSFCSTVCLLDEPVPGVSDSNARVTWKRLMPRSLQVFNHNPEDNFWKLAGQYIDTQKVQHLEFQRKSPQNWDIAGWDFSKLDSLMMMIDTCYVDGSVIAGATWSPRFVTLEFVEYLFDFDKVAENISRIVAQFPSAETVEIFLHSKQELIETFPSNQTARIKSAIQSLASPLSSFTFAFVLDKYDEKLPVLDWMDSQEQRWNVLVPTREDISVEFGIYWRVNKFKLFPPRHTRKSVKVPRWTIDGHLDYNS